jgi:site-specific recombinase XerD
MKKDIIKIHRYETEEGSMIAVAFPFTEPCKSLVKQLNGRRWCSVNKWIYVKNTPENLHEIFTRFKGVAWIDARDYYKRGSAYSSEVRIINSIQRQKTYVQFPFGERPEWVEMIRKIDNAYYIARTGDWAIPGNNENYLKVKKYFTAQGCTVKTKNVNVQVNSRNNKSTHWYIGKPVERSYLKDFENLLTLKRVSANTSKCYKSMFTRFLAYFYQREVNTLTKADIISYLLWEIQENGISLTVQNQMINAIKYYYEKVLGKPREIYELPRPKTVRHEPVILNSDELQKILSGIENIKHRCILSLIFSAGLRRNELLNLKVQDIDMERKVINIHKGKGNKDRISILADTTEKHINEYLLKYKPKYWLFQGPGGEKYSAESVWKIFNRVKKQYHIEKKGNVHLLRHTFETNLLEAGTDIRYIQKLLGHSSLKTTEIYTHVANHNLIGIKSPIDRLGI